MFDFLKRFLALCILLFGIQSLDAQPVDYSALKNLLHDPQRFNAHVDQDLLKEFELFHKTIEDDWFKRGLRQKLRRLKQSKSAMSLEVYGQVLEHAHRALLLKEKVETNVRKSGRTSPEGLGTLSNYFTNVYVPILRVRSEGAVFLEVTQLGLEMALWPNFTDSELLKILDQEMREEKLREPAAVLPAGASGSRDASSPIQEFSEDINPLLGERLAGYAESLKSAAEKSRRAAELEQEIAQLEKSRPRGSRSATNRASRDSEYRARREAKSREYHDRMAVLRRENDKLKGASKNNEKEVIGFFAEASKLTTLQLMLSQVHFYQHITDNPVPLDMEKVAASCVETYKELPPVLRFQIGSQEERLFDMETFLVNSGVLFRESSAYAPVVDESEEASVYDGGLDAFNEFFLADKGRDPLKGFYTGMLPFYQMRVAQQGQEAAQNNYAKEDWSDLYNPTAKLSFGSLGTPAFDDVEHFHDVFEFLYKKIAKSLRPEDYDHIEDVFYINPAPLGNTPAYGEEGFDEFHNALEWSGVTPYIQNKLVEKSRSIDAWESIIPTPAWLQMKRNQIRMDFPPFYGPEPYKQWALRLLYKSLTDENEGQKLISYLCRPDYSDQPTNWGWVSADATDAELNIVDSGYRFPAKFCESFSSTQEIYQTLKERLAPFDERGPFVPPSLSYSQNLRTLWSELNVLWVHLRDEGILNQFPDEQGPVFDEMTFVKNQFGLNPWIVLRISVLGKIHDLENNTVEGISRAQRNRLLKALKSTPLGHVKRPVRPMYANTLFRRGETSFKVWESDQDKDIFKLWESIEKRHHDGNTHIFRGRIRGQKDHYALFERLESRSLLTSRDVLNSVNEFGLRSNGDLREMNELLAFAEEGDDATRFEVIMKIMNSPGKYEEHQKILEEHLLTQGYEEDFDDPQKIKLAFLERDSRYKFPLASQILKSASTDRTKALLSNMGSLCDLNTADEKDWDKLMSMTAHTQQMFSQTFNLDGVPPEVMKFYDRWKEEDKRDMRSAGILMAGYVGISISAGLCASGVGSWAGCPLAATLLTITSAGALSYSTVDLITNSFDQAAGREERMRLGNTFKSLGYSDTESVNRQKGRGWGAFAFEVVTAATLYVPVMTASKVVGRQTVTLAANYALKRSALKSKGVDIIKTSWEAVELRSAQAALGLVSKKATVGSIFQKMFSKVAKVSKGKHFVNYIKKEFLDEVVVVVTKADIDRKTGEAIAKFFKNDKAAFAKFVQDEMAPKISKVENLMHKASRTGNPKYLTKIQQQFKTMYMQPHRMGHFDTALLRNKQILSRLSSDLLKKEGVELAEYIAKHADVLAPILSEFKFSPKRLLGYAYYYIFSAGAPWAYSNGAALRAWSARPYVSRIFASREKIMFHNWRRLAQEGLDLGSGVAMFDQLKLVRAKQAMVLKTVNNLEESSDAAVRALGDKLNLDLRRYQLELSRKIATKEALRKGVNADDVLIKVTSSHDPRLGTMLLEDIAGNGEVAARIREIDNILFRGSMDELGEARRLLRKLSPEELFDIGEFADSVDRVLGRMAHETRDLDKLADYVALQAQYVKMLVLPPKTHQVILY